MWQFEVPNAPCGVERLQGVSDLEIAKAFLMHRVELKAFLGFLLGFLLGLFLMHRVELKVVEDFYDEFKSWLFLMHRVELKV